MVSLGKDDGYIPGLTQKSDATYFRQAPRGNGLRRLTLSDLG